MSQLEVAKSRLSTRATPLQSWVLNHGATVSHTAGAVHFLHPNMAQGLISICFWYSIPLLAGKPPTTSHRMPWSWQPVWTITFCILAYLPDWTPPSTSTRIYFLIFRRKDQIIFDVLLPHFCFLSLQFMKSSPAAHCDTATVTRKPSLCICILCNK